MKTDELIKKAAKHGLIIDAATADNYVDLSDEELENLDISGGDNKCGGDKDGAKIANLKDDAENCPHFEVANPEFPNRKCNRCKHMVLKGGELKGYCKHPSKQQKEV